MDRNLLSAVASSMKLLGQARKSLWIETAGRADEFFQSMVRLVRACGSKQMSTVQAISQAWSGS